MIRAWPNELAQSFERNIVSSTTSRLRRIYIAGRRVRVQQQQGLSQASWAVKWIQANDLVGRVCVIDCWAREERNKKVVALMKSLSSIILSSD